MKNLFKIFLLFLLLTPTLYCTPIIWLHDYDEALRLAKIQDKDIYLFIGADRCGFCEKYKKETLIKPEVMKKLAQDYIPVYLSRDQHFIPSHFEKYGVPRHYFLDAKGKVFYDTRGLLEVDGFYTMLDEAELSKE